MTEAVLVKDYRYENKEQRDTFAKFLAHGLSGLKTVTVSTFEDEEFSPKKYFVRVEELPREDGTYASKEYINSVYGKGGLYGLREL